MRRAFVYRRPAMLFNGDDQPSPNGDGPSEPTNGDGWRAFTPTYEEGERPVTELAKLLTDGIAERLTWLDDEIAAARDRDPSPLRYLTTLVLLRDLLSLGWSVRCVGGGIWVRPHEGDGLPSKRAVRQQLLHGRGDQLREPKVRGFIEKLERPARSSRLRSVVNVIADGRALAERLRPVAALPRDRRAEVLRELCRPYLQAATLDDRDDETRHLRFHVWRYFRYTWASRYRRPPGRHVAFLVRDAAQPGHPVMAITALSSAVLQLTPRDDWAGWTTGGLARLLDRGDVHDAEALAALRRRVREDIAALYTVDLGFDGNAPPLLDDDLDRRLLSLAAEASIDRGEALAQGTAQRLVSFDPQSLLERTQTPLFRAKRAATARSLLKVHRALDEVTSLRDALRDPPSRDAVNHALRQVKQHFASASVMDIATCGAVPPYGSLLAGKLACMLMLTPFVREAVWKAYNEEPSVIASQMAGRPIVKPPALVMLTTTSLYPERSSQYNRLRLPAGTMPGQSVGLAFTEVGRSQGHGSTHLSTEAEDLLAEVAASRREFRNVNFVFGEGQSAKLRELREATAALGLGAAEILRHDSPRIVYVAPLVASPQRVLLGVDPVPATTAGDDGVEAVAEYWRSRWLASRLDHAPALDALAASPRSSLALSREYEDDGPTAWLGDAFKR